MNLENQDLPVLYLQYVPGRPGLTSGIFTLWTWKTRNTRNLEDQDLTLPKSNMQYLKAIPVNFLWCFYFKKSGTQILTSGVFTLGTWKTRTCVFTLGTWKTRTYQWYIYTGNLEDQDLPVVYLHYEPGRPGLTSGVFTLGTWKTRTYQWCIYTGNLEDQDLPVVYLHYEPGRPGLTSGVFTLGTWKTRTYQWCIYTMNLELTRTYQTRCGVFTLGTWKTRKTRTYQWCIYTGNLEDQDLPVVYLHM